MNIWNPGGSREDESLRQQLLEDNVFILSADEPRAFFSGGEERVACRSAGDLSGDSRFVRPAICIKLSGSPSDQALNLSLFGCDSATDLAFGAGRWEGKTYDGGPCPACGGTGVIRYNYGSSDLEAWLTGHDACTLGTCPMCGGRG